MRPLGLIAFAILAALAAWLAVANRTAVVFSLDAFRAGDPASSAEIPLFLVLLLGALAGMVIGALYMIGRQMRLSRRLAEETARADRLQAMLADEVLSKASASPVLPSRISD